MYHLRRNHKNPFIIFIHLFTFSAIEVFLSIMDDRLLSLFFSSSIYTKEKLNEFKLTNNEENISKDITMKIMQVQRVGYATWKINSFMQFSIFY